MKLGYCYKTKEGMYSITVDEEFLDDIIKVLMDKVTNVANIHLADEINVYEIWNLASIFMELKELKKSEGV